MSEEVEEQDHEEAVSEQPELEQEGQQDEQKMVPLAAMLATRKKLQEAEARATKAEADKSAYQEYLMRLKAEQNNQPEEEEDLSAIVEKKDLIHANALAKRDILEAVFQDSNPEAVRQINKHLHSILEKKPWLAKSVDEAPNRYARAYEIIQDYLHLVEERPVVRKTDSSDGKRIVQNANKPRSPTEFGKSANPQGIEYLKSIQGKKEFREYRQKLLNG